MHASSIPKFLKTSISYDFPKIKTCWACHEHYTSWCNFDKFCGKHLATMACLCLSGVHFLIFAIELKTSTSIRTWQKTFDQASESCWPKYNWKLEYYFSCLNNAWFLDSLGWICCFSSSFCQISLPKWIGAYAALGILNCIMKPQQMDNQLKWFSSCFCWQHWRIQEGQGAPKLFLASSFLVFSSFLLFIFRINLSIWSIVVLCHNGPPKILFISALVALPSPQDFALDPPLVDNLIFGKPLVSGFNFTLEKIFLVLFRVNTEDFT